jgi:hypothetical protein
VLTELGQNYSDGVRRAILHGTPYTRTFNGFNSEWPGWLPFGSGSYGSSYTYREAYWKDFGTETGFMSRVQAVLMNGKAKIDLAVLIDREKSFDFESGNRFQYLLDSGWSYNLVSESVLNSENAAVSDGMLAKDGPSYKALIADQLHVISPGALQKLAEYAKAGLPLVLLNCDIRRVYGSDVKADAEAAAVYASLAGLANVRIAASPEEIPSALASLGVHPYAQYDAPQLEATLYTDDADKTNYYYLFNNSFPANAGMMGNDQGNYYKGEEKALRDVTVTLTGSGVPYLLDPYTGRISAIRDFTANDGSVTFTVDRMAGGTAMICAIAENTGAFDARAGEKTVPVRETQPIDLSGELWNLVIHSYGPDENSGDPGVSRITDVDFGVQPLGIWAEISASEEQLKALGTDDMKYVSGTGEYTLQFTSPENWNSFDGAYVELTYGKDQIGAVIVNGTEIPANNAGDRVDAGALFKKGKNEITVRLNSTLYGRTYAEHSGYRSAGADYGMNPAFMAPLDPEAYYNGLLGVKIIPYTKK